MGGPRGAVTFLLTSGILFAVLLIELGFRTPGEPAAGVIAAAVVVGAAVIALAVMLAKGVGEGRL